jgi:C-terminal processing protease CtpA/Prc
VPVYLLTSRRTISAAESFAFGLRIKRQVTIVGEPTAGGGHFGEFVQLPGGYLMFLPRGRTYNPRTNEGWEASGLRPDVQVPAARALSRALELIRSPKDPGEPDSPAEAGAAA